MTYYLHFNVTLTNGKGYSDLLHSADTLTEIKASAEVFRRDVLRGEGGDVAEINNLWATDDSDNLVGEY
jgi:hypothetical protein